MYYSVVSVNSKIFISWLIISSRQSDYFKGCLLAAVTNAPGTRSNLRQILGLFAFLDLTDPKHVFTSDLKVMNMVTGLLGGATKYPYNRCTYCWTSEQEDMPGLGCIIMRCRNANQRIWI